MSLHQRFKERDWEYNVMPISHGLAISIVMRLNCGICQMIPLSTARSCSHQLIACSNCILHVQHLCMVPMYCPGGGTVRHLGHLSDNRRTSVRHLSGICRHLSDNCRTSADISELSTGHFSWTRPDPPKRWPDPTRPAISDKKSDPTRPAARPFPNMYSLQLNNYIY